MARESFQSMVPPTRIGIKLEVDKEGATEEIELPLRLLILGDFTMKEDPTEIQLRKPKSINKDNFDAIMQDMNLGLSFSVPNRLANDGTELAVDLNFESMKDFEPGRVAEQIPALKRLLQARTLLEDLKARVKTKPEIRKSLQALISEMGKNPDDSTLISKLNTLLNETES